MRDFIFNFDIEYLTGKELSYEDLREFYHHIQFHLTSSRIDREIVYTYNEHKFLWRRVYNSYIPSPLRIIDKEMRYEILKRQKWRCNICSKILKFGNKSKWEGEMAHIDHIHPYSKRETYKNGCERINESENLQALCEECNRRKSNKLG